MNLISFNLKLMVGIITFLPLLSNGQNSPIKQNRKTGIIWTYGLNWEQIKSEAQSQNKFIFIDCYASWCKPCKAMDSLVYSLDSVGEFVNNRFISLKVQMDSTDNDNIETRNWYSFAKNLVHQYAISAFPTYLFFSPNGSIIHKDIGFRQPGAFLGLVKNSLDSSRQYYTLLQKHKEGSIDYGKVPYLVYSAIRYNEKGIGIAIARAYIDSYLLKLKEHELYSKTNIEFIANYVQTTDELGFLFLYQNRDKIDSVMQKRGTCQAWTDRIIYQGVIYPYLDSAIKKAITVPWGKIQRILKKSFSYADAERITLQGKVRWYEYKEDWKQYVKYATKQIEKYPFDISDQAALYTVNHVSWNIFLHNNKLKYLNTAIKWMEKVVIKNSKSISFLDTYANLLYKVGKKNVAISIQEKAVEFNANPEDKYYVNTLEKMRTDQPTWPTK